jgi:hypothetical protein
MAPSSSPINSVTLPVGKVSIGVSIRERQRELARVLTDLEPYLLIESSNLLGGVQVRAFLTLRLHGNMTVDLGMGSQVAMMLRRNASRRRRLRVCHYCVSMVRVVRERIRRPQCFRASSYPMSTRHTHKPATKKSTKTKPRRQEGKKRRLNGQLG